MEATFSNGAAQSQPDKSSAPVSQTNGTTTPPQTSPGGTPFLTRVASIPLVSEVTNTAYNVIQSNSYSAAAYNKAESLANGVINRVYPAAQNHVGPQIQAADNFANRSLDFVEKKIPIAFQPSSEIIGQARRPVDQAAQQAQARFGPYTEQFSNQLTQAQTNLHNVQEKLASVVASLPRSPKDVQTTVHEVTSSLLNEIEKLQHQISGSAKGLPTNVQSAVQPLFEQLQQAASDIRSELARTDVPLTTRAANVLNYSRTNTEKALREALDRVSALLSKSKSDAEKTVDQVADTAGAKADQAQAEVKKATS